MAEISNNVLAQTQSAQQAAATERAQQAQQAQQAENQARVEQQQQSQQASGAERQQNVSISAVNRADSAQVSEDPLQSAQQEIQKSAGTATLVQANQSVEAVVQLVS